MLWIPRRTPAVLVAKARTLVFDCLCGHASPTWPRTCRTLFCCGVKHCSTGDSVGFWRRISLMSTHGQWRSLHVTSCGSKHGSPMIGPDADSTQTGSDDDTDALLDAQRKEVLEDEYILPAIAHRILVIQPEFKQLQRKARSTTSDLQLAEACALVESLNWTVCGQIIQTIKVAQTKTLFTSGVLAELTKLIELTRQKKDATAVFISTNTLSAVQLGSLQKAWNLPVYDRYTIVLQIFMLRARTTEAKLQVALAELPFLRSRLRGMHEGRLDQQAGGLARMGGSGETFLEIRQRILQHRQLRLKKSLARIREKREVLRQDRAKREIPIVAVVGYTNAGKTSLIKALTGAHGLIPRDQLFATLDVTAHAGILPNMMKVLYLDTVGFISDIPTSLIQSFAATLEDVKLADAIVHVQDVSHPDHVAQRLNVQQTLAELHLPDTLLNTVIEVGNKVDLLDGAPNGEQVYVSALNGQGLQTLTQRLAETIIDNTGRVCKRLKLPMKGLHLSWLYKEAVVTSAVPDDQDPECLVVDAVMTIAAHAKFKATFGKRKRKQR